METKYIQLNKQLELNGHDFIFGKINEQNVKTDLFKQNCLNKTLLNYLIEQSTNYKDVKFFIFYFNSY